LDQLYVVTHPDPILLEARAIEHEATPEGGVALAYFHRGHLLARGVVTAEAATAIGALLRRPVSVALAATEDAGGNIEARVCLVLPMDGAGLEGGDPDGEDEPWKASVPVPPDGLGSSWDDRPPDERPRIALLPIGNVVRSARNRKHGDVPSDAREMLRNLLTGRAQDAVSRAIDDLLDSL
jgi:hypothetical protein